ncbi:SDR family NAD(P)-dependent oxidoreductase [Mycetocola zhujimingii]|uniref:SDR family NAD(P)-dependent oxidoreductase n=1 Tax=Mycetocola zhujimingii TaxID=2079792 RepID=UPI000D38C284|nr:SDR family oxidoreductase [Mycetocola zhujimingii]AWB85472.1 oxidoreductase [Mycetocola zhujimingii]
MTTTTTRPLAGKTALVTGASRGLGAGLATELAAQGAKVAITYWSSPERAAQVVTAIQDAGGEAVAIRADNSTADGAREGVREAAAKLGSLDILVNSAGAGWFEPFQDATDEHIEHTININIRGTVYATQEAINHLSDGGRIITIGSVTAESLPFPGAAIYGMTKAALVALTKGLARDLASRKITANIVQPGPIDTEGNPAGGPAGELLAGLTAAGRFGTVEEVGPLVAWIASDQAAYMTGSTVTIDGGWTA